MFCCVGRPDSAATQKGSGCDFAQDRNAPDPVGSAVQELLARVEALETEVTGHVSPEGVYRPVDGVWESTDFSI